MQAKEVVYRGAHAGNYHETTIRALVATSQALTSTFSTVFGTSRPFATRMALLCCMHISCSPPYTILRFEAWQVV